MSRITSSSIALALFLVRLTTSRRMDCVSPASFPVSSAQARLHSVHPVILLIFCLKATASLSVLRVTLKKTRNASHVLQSQIASLANKME